MYWIGFRVTAWLGALVLLGAAALVAVLGSWTDALIPAGLFLVLALYLSLQNWLPTLFDLLLAAAMLISTGGWAGRFYWQIAWYDEVAHAFTTMAVALVATFLGYAPLLNVLRRYPLQLALAVLSMGIAIGALWEMIEWTIYWFIGPNSGQVLKDEVMDLMVDAVGALAAVPLALWAVHAWQQRVSHREREETGQ